MPNTTTRHVAVALVACLIVPASARAQHRAALRTAIAMPTEAGVATAPPRAAALGAAGLSVPAPPPRSAGARLGLQFLAAGAGAVGGGLGTYLILRDASETRVKGDEGYTRSGNVGYLVGSFAGATIGAHVVGRTLGGNAPLWATSLGALIGSAPLLALGVDEPYLPLYGVVLAWIPQAALAAGGFIMAESR